MKKAFLMLCLLIAGIPMMRAEEPTIEWAVEAGLNLSKPTDVNYVRTGFNAGALMFVNLPKNWFLNAGLKLSSAPMRDRSFYGSYENPDNIHYYGSEYSRTPYRLVVPLQAGYRFNLSNPVKLFIKAGPYLGVGLWGHGKNTYWENNPSHTTDSFRIGNVYSHDDTDHLRRFEIGLDANVGVELHKHYLISFGYELQFNKIGEWDRDRNQIFSFNLGYKF